MNSLNEIKSRYQRLALKFYNDKLQGRPQMMWIALVVLSGLFALVWDSSHASATPPAMVATAAPAQLESMIPAGFVLVPIQVSNFESLDSILGPYGIVDLFVPGGSGGTRARKVASRVKIVRAPQNPSQFAVLIEAAASEKLLSQGGAFFAVIQNTKEAGTGIVMSNERPRHMAHSSRLIMEAPGQ